ncbi:MAG: hypothetical protein SCJ94_08605 [Bacillota bacterium]|nr:hypothetical protein [Bacillota bacterium]
MIKKDLLAPLIFLFILILSLTGCLEESGEEEGILPEPEGSENVEEPSFADIDEPIPNGVLVTAYDEVFGWSAAFKWVGPATYVGLDFSYFLEESILWVTEIGGDSRIIDLRASSFYARLQ